MINDDKSLIKCSLHEVISYFLQTGKQTIRRWLLANDNNGITVTKIATSGQGKEIYEEDLVCQRNQMCYNSQKEVGKKNDNNFIRNYTNIERSRRV